MPHEIQSVTIDGELTDLNTYIKAMNKNRFAGQQIKNQETELVAWHARLERMKPVEKYPVRIHYTWYSKDKRKDLDNVAFAKKQINDGLVSAGVLVDDSRKYIAGFTDTFEIDKHKPRIVVRIESC